MKSLILKELYSLKSMGGLIYVVFVLACLPFCIFTDSLILISLFPSVIIQLIFFTMHSDFSLGWNSYSAVMPIDRKSIISVKYLFIIIFTAISYILILTAIVMRNCFYTELLDDELICLLLLSPLSGITMPAIDIPVTIKFGTEKGAAVQFLLLFALMIPVFLLTDKTGNGIAPDLKAVTPYFNIIFPTALIISAVILALSWILSVKFFEKKDL